MRAIQSPRPICVRGVGSYLPGTLVTADQIDARTGAEPGWTARVTGVLTRHEAGAETQAEMGAKAVRAALDSAGLTMDDIDALVCCSAGVQQPIPVTAALILGALDRPEAGIPAFDINMTCLSFVIGLDLIAWPVAAGHWRRVVLVSTEIASVGLDHAHKESAALFGDGAAAVVLERSPEGSGARLVAARHAMYPEGADLCEIRGGGTALHPNSPGVTAQDFKFSMHGPGLFFMVSDLMPPFLDDFFEPLPYGLRDVDLIIPHQASIPALELMRKRLDLREDRFWVTAQEVGNVIAASIPLGLVKAIEAGRARPGDKVLLLGSSAGFALGAALLEL